MNFGRVFLLSKEYIKKQNLLIGGIPNYFGRETDFPPVLGSKTEKSPKTCHLWRLRSPWCFMRFMHVAHDFYSLGRDLSIYTSFGTFPAHFRLISAGATDTHTDGRMLSLPKLAENVPEMCRN